jgi:hypothetical protein
MADEKESTIYVIAKKGKDKAAHNRVVLWEQDPRHPEGEAFVVREDKVVEVFPTARVKQLLGEEALEKTTEAPKAPAVKEDNGEGDGEAKTGLFTSTPSTIRRGGRPERP